MGDEEGGKPQPQEIFNLEGVNHRRVERFKPEFIANGGENKRIQQLRDHFGEEHVPYISKNVLKVPITPAIVQEAYRKYRKEIPSKFKRLLGSGNMDRCNFSKKDK